MVAAGGTVLVEVSHGAVVAADVTVGWVRWTAAKTRRHDTYTTEYLRKLEIVSLRLLVS